MKRDLLHELAGPDDFGAVAEPVPVKVGAVSAQVCERPAESVLAAWDRLVAETKESDVTQLSGWAAVRRTVGYEPLYVFAWQSDVLVGGAQVLVRRVPLLGRIGYVSYGPVVAAAASRAAVVAALADAL